MHKKYRVSPIALDPTVYYRLNDNWLELSARFLAPDHGFRRVKDLISRDVITALDEANIGVASGTYAIVHIPPVEIAYFPNARVAMILLHLRTGDFERAGMQSAGGVLQT